MLPLNRSTVHSAGLYMLARAVPKAPPALRQKKPQVWWWADSWADARQQWHTRQAFASAGLPAQTATVQPPPTP